jgi:hypothetical protein
MALARPCAPAQAGGDSKECAMNCIACGREGHNSSRCSLQLWRHAQAARVPAPAPAVRPPALVGGLCTLQSHDRSREAWLALSR